MSMLFESFYWVATRYKPSLYETAPVGIGTSSG